MGGVTIFCQKFLFLESRKFRGEPFNVSETLGYRKMLCIIGGITIFRRIFFSLKLPNIFVGDPSPSDKSSGFERNFP